MSQPIFSITSDGSEKKSKAVANLLPCRIHHDGPVGETESFWEPKTEVDGKHVAYFRGRKLHGKTVKLPENYTGVVVEKSDKKIETRRPEDDEDMEDAEPQPELGAMDVKAEFDEIVIWGHEATADSSDPYVRSIEEWLTVAEQIHSYPAPEAKTDA
ncbi:ribonuclease H1/H2 small subunit [Colletotrichum plurivorum]|uniref:Ribonuclease H1/H2 small subunit n=1 Tax=Colletotrichum plurivorum TaxID=2175906 RepID=A0A8H6NAG8_9PEZI|nr:ribonuclease H1/H2 small subunit [Colletotrichum plurivorum]